MAGGPMMRSYLNDAAVKDRRLAGSTLRRILRFARPYRGQLLAFVALLVLSAAAARARTRVRSPPGSRSSQQPSPWPNAGSRHGSARA